MLRIKLNPSMDIQQNLVRQLRSLDNEIGEIEHVMQQLGGLSGMDAVLMGLRRRRDQLEESRRTLDRMQKCLEKVILSYDSCEDRLCDYAQQEIIVYRRHSIGTSSLDNISGLLQSVF